MIALSPGVVIGIRSVIALVLLTMLIRISGISFRIDDPVKNRYVLFSGVFLAAHWVTYFFSLQLSSVALGMLSMFTYPVITVILEPLYIKTKFRPVHIPVSLLAFAGIYILLPDFDINNHETRGILTGVGSAFLYACRNLVLRKHATTINGLVVIHRQLAVVVLITLPFFYFTPVTADKAGQYAIPLLFLGIVTTAMGHSFFVKSLQFFSASTVSILSNFTPVVGIMLGIIFLQENPTGNILLGGILIMIAAVVEIGQGYRRT